MWQVFVVLIILAAIFLYFRYSWSSRWEAFDNAMRAQYGSVKGRRATLWVVFFGLLVVFTLAGLVGPMLSPYQPLDIVARPLLPPSLPPRFFTCAGSRKSMGLGRRRSMRWPGTKPGKSFSTRNCEVK